MNGECIRKKMSNHLDIISHNYELHEAVADLIDNSITAGATKIWIDFGNRKNDKYTGDIIILDNGRGMNKQELEKALELNSS